MYGEFAEFQLRKSAVAGTFCLLIFTKQLKLYIKEFSSESWKRKRHLLPVLFCRNIILKLQKKLL